MQKEDLVKELSLKFTGRLKSFGGLLVARNSNRISADLSQNPKKPIKYIY